MYWRNNFVGIFLPLDGSADQGWRQNWERFCLHHVQWNPGGIEFLNLWFQLEFHQIGSTWVVTAAHCVFGKNREIISEKTLSILLGLHDRSAASELKRLNLSFFWRPWRTIAFRKEINANNCLQKRDQSRRYLCSRKLQCIWQKSKWYCSAPPG